MLQSSVHLQRIGVPLAVIAGSRIMMKEFEGKSETRLHCSPPSFAVIRAADHALLINHIHGEVLRSKLMRLVRYLRARLAELCIGVTADCSSSNPPVPARGRS